MSGDPFLDGGVGRPPDPLDEHGEPRRIEAGGHPLGGADHPVGAPAGADADEEPLGGRPRFVDRPLPAGRLHIGVDPPSGLAEGELPERLQVRLLEEPSERPLGLFGEINPPGLQAFEQFFRGEVHQFQFVGLVEDAVGHGLPDRNPGDLADHVVEAVDVLDVERRPDVDPRFQEFLHVLPALRMAAALGVGVGQFINEDQIGLSGERRIKVELA